MKSCAGPGTKAALLNHKDTIIGPVLAGPSVMRIAFPIKFKNTIIISIADINEWADLIAPRSRSVNCTIRSQGAYKWIQNLE
jgi:hypothetical protein